MSTATLPSRTGHPDVTRKLSERKKKATEIAGRHHQGNASGYYIIISILLVYHWYIISISLLVPPVIEPPLQVSQRSHLERGGRALTLFADLLVAFLAGLLHLIALFTLLCLAQAA